MSFNEQTAFGTVVNEQITFVVNPIINNNNYGESWEDSLEPPTQGSLYDQIQAMLAAMPTMVYKVTLNQAGTGDPTLVASVNNSLGEAPILSRIGTPGVYEIGVAGTQFTLLKTIPLVCLAVGATAAKIEIEHTAVNKISIASYDEAGDPVDIEGDFHVFIEVHV